MMLTHHYGNLRLVLAEFREQVKTGTVRGQGTPAVGVTSAGGTGDGATGVGGLGLMEAALGILLLAGAWRRERRG